MVLLALTTSIRWAKAKAKTTKSQPILTAAETWAVSVDKKCGERERDRQTDRHRERHMKIRRKKMSEKKSE